jgi:hypothetical protein
MKEGFDSIHDYETNRDTGDRLVSDSEWNSLAAALNATRAEIGSAIESDRPRLESLADELERERQSQVRQTDSIKAVHAQIRDFQSKLQAADDIRDIRSRAGLPPLEDLERDRNGWADAVAQLTETSIAQEESLAHINERSDALASDPKVMGIEEERAHMEDASRSESSGSEQHQS